MVILAIALYLFFKPSLTALDTVVKIAAVIVGGAWTYLNYVRGRTYSRRLELAVSGAVTERDDVYFFNGECRAKNVGLSKISIGHFQTNVLVSAIRLARAKDGWLYTDSEDLIALPLFERHGWIEPGETISEPVSAPVGKGAQMLLGIRTEVIVNDGKSIWSTSNITSVGQVAKKEGV
jgi:hypothetical protein